MHLCGLFLFFRVIPCCCCAWSGMSTLNPPAHLLPALVVLPQWVEFLCFDINVHVPHHVMSKIPWYNLRAATESLRQNWGEYMTEATFNWRMLKVG